MTRGERPALDAFVIRPTRGATTRVTPSRLVDPPGLPGAPLFKAQPRLYLGKAARTLGA